MPENLPSMPAVLLTPACFIAIIFSRNAKGVIHIMKFVKHFNIILTASLLSLTFSTAQAADFSDVPADSKYYNAISEISELGVVTGYADGTFKPENNITKAELAVMIARLTPYDFFDSAQYPQLFKDVPSDYWAYPFISKAAYCGVFSTFENTPYNDINIGTTAATVPNIENDIFLPDSNITYAEAVKAITTLLGYNGIAEKNGGFPNGYLFTARVFGFTEGVDEHQADEYISRADFCSIVCNALDIHQCVEGAAEQNAIDYNTPYIKYDGYVIYATVNDTLRIIMNPDPVIE